LRWVGVFTSFLLVAGCAGGWDARQALGTQIDGARFGAGWLFGGPSIYVYPSGTVHTRYEGGTKSMRLGSKVTYIDKKLWDRLTAIVVEKGGKDLVDLTRKEGSVCDGGYESLYIKVGDKTGYYIFDGMDCDITVEKYDAAGLEIKVILEELMQNVRTKRS
jgi:hypothetical protein